MPAVSSPNRSPVFRLITIASSGLGSFMLGLWGLKFGFGDGIAGMPAELIGAIIASLCTLAAGGAAISFFAGVDELVGYVFKETHFDKLTGLLSRPAMVGKIAQAAQSTIKTGDPIFLIDIDIDRFKQINEQIGYSQGDELIRAFTRRLRASLPEGVVIGRIGAGEFAVLYPDASFTMSMKTIAEELINELMEPYDLGGISNRSMCPSASSLCRRTVDPVLYSDAPISRCRMRAQAASATGPCSIPTSAKSPTIGSGSNPSSTPPSSAAISTCITSRRWTC